MQTIDHQQILPEKEEVLTHSAARSISDDDLCANCRHIAYIPGKLSLCLYAYRGHEWPATIDSDGYAESCEHYAANEGIDYETAADYLSELFGMTIAEKERILSDEENDRYIFLVTKLQSESIPIPFGIEI